VLPIHLSLSRVPDTGCQESKAPSSRTGIKAFIGSQNPQGVVFFWNLNLKVMTGRFDRLPTLITREDAPPNTPHPRYPLKHGPVRPRFYRRPRSATPGASKSRRQHQTNGRGRFILSLFRTAIGVNPMPARASMCIRPLRLIWSNYVNSMKNLSMTFSWGLRRTSSD
jgi:hypothetical protein